MMWTLYTALPVIREINTQLGQLQAWVAVSGGVLNVGYSESDLDLQVIPRTDSKATIDQARHVISDIAGFELRETCLYRGRTIDVFVLNETKRIEVCYLGWDNR